MKQMFAVPSTAASFESLAQVPVKRGFSPSEVLPGLFLSGESVVDSAAAIQRLSSGSMAVRRILRCNATRALLRKKTSSCQLDHDGSAAASVTPGEKGKGTQGGGHVATYAVGPDNTLEPASSSPSGNFGASTSSSWLEVVDAKTGRILAIAFLDDGHALQTSWYGDSTTGKGANDIHGSRIFDEGDPTDGEENSSTQNSSPPLPRVDLFQVEHQLLLAVANQQSGKQSSSPPECITRLNLIADDDADFDLRPFFALAVDYIALGPYHDGNGVTSLTSAADGLRGGLLVHCKAGVSRSVTLVVAYLMVAHGLAAADALRFVSRRRPMASPNEGFKQQLAILEAVLVASVDSSET